LQREPRFEVVYHLLKLPTQAASPAQIGTPQRLRILCGVSESDPSLPTATDLWRSADWAEREIWDLFGIRFEGHPDLRRIQLPHHWEGHPLRKDYPLRGPARERSPRPAFPLKSNVVAGTPPAGRTAQSLAQQIAQRRGERSGTTPAGAKEQEFHPS
jgi:NADH:ubiquinone oxidoreductase subunit C